MSMSSSPFPPLPSLSVPSGASQQTLLLDSDIRDWVVLPLLVIMIAAGLLRHFVGLLLKPQPKQIPKLDQRVKNLCRAAVRLRSGSLQYIATHKGHARRQAWAQKGKPTGGDEDTLVGVGYLRQQIDWAAQEKEENPTPSDVDPMNPMAGMMDGMKGNMVFMVQNMVMMQGISHFFQGFILLKVPFPLTRGFKQMFQRGLAELTGDDLDTSYVSSVSWYFLVMFGLRGFFRMVIGDPTQEQQEDTTKQQFVHGFQTKAAAAPGQQFDAEKVLTQEADNLELMAQTQKSALEDVEKRLLGKKYPKKKLQGKGDLYGGYGGGAATSTASKTKKKKV